MSVEYGVAQVCGRAATEERASEELLLSWPRLALRFGRMRAALEASAQACQVRRQSAALWQQRLLLEAQQAALQVRIEPSIASTLIFGL